MSFIIASEKLVFVIIGFLSKVICFFFHLLCLLRFSLNHNFTVICLGMGLFIWSGYLEYTLNLRPCDFLQFWKLSRYVFEIFLLDILFLLYVTPLRLYWFLSIFCTYVCAHRYTHIHVCMYILCVFVFFLCIVLDTFPRKLLSETLML